jgi:hypothetical protein
MKLLKDSSIRSRKSKRDKKSVRIIILAEKVPELNNGNKVLNNT